MSDNSLTLKIVHYNYVPPEESVGGGVTVYLRNLIDGLSAAGHQNIVLHSGDRYDLIRQKPRLHASSSGESLTIFNSPVVAPAVFSFHSPEHFVEDSSLDSVADEILRSIGHVDVFHFHNIEGLTSKFIAALRRAFSSSAFVLSAHNYSTVCPQVNLWRSNLSSCTDFAEGVACVTCVSSLHDRDQRITSNRLKTPFKTIRLLSRAEKMLRKIDKALSKRRIKRIETSPLSAPAINGGAAAVDVARRSSDYRAYRSTGLGLVNSIFDVTVAVSERTAAILRNYGADPSRIICSYIGTKHRDKFDSCTRKTPSADDIHACYLGYMRSDKGFFYLLDALERIPHHAASRLSFTVAAKGATPDIVDRMSRLRSRLRIFRYFDGYSHADLEDILGPVNVGIVPPLWEDNLPQVAIELVANGVPIITSNRGGAQEIGANSDLVFDADDPSSLARMLQALLDGGLDASVFWSKTPRLRSNSEHASEMVDIYRGAIRSRLASNLDELTRIGS